MFGNPKLREEAKQILLDSIEAVYKSQSGIGSRIERVRLTYCINNYERSERCQATLESVLEHPEGLSIHDYYLGKLDIVFSRLKLAE